MKFIKKLMLSALAICLLLSNIIVVNAEENDDKTYFFSSQLLDSLTGSNVFNLDLSAEQAVISSDTFKSVPIGTVMNDGYKYFTGYEDNYSLLEYHPATYVDDMNNSFAYVTNGAIVTSLDEAIAQSPSIEKVTYIKDGDRVVAEKDFALSINANIMGFDTKEAIQAGLEKTYLYIYKDTTQVAKVPLLELYKNIYNKGYLGTWNVKVTQGDFIKGEVTDKDSTVQKVTGVKLNISSSFSDADCTDWMNTFEVTNIEGVTPVYCTSDVSTYTLEVPCESDMDIEYKAVSDFGREITGTISISGFKDLVDPYNPDLIILKPNLKAEGIPNSTSKAFEISIVSDIEAVVNSSDSLLLTEELKESDSRYIYKFLINANGTYKFEATPKNGGDVSELSVNISCFSNTSSPDDNPSSIDSDTDTNKPIIPIDEAQITPDESNDAPATGDTFSVVSCILIALGSLALLVYCMIKKKRGIAMFLAILMLLSSVPLTNIFSPIDVYANRTDDKYEGIYGGNSHQPNGEPQMGVAHAAYRVYLVDLNSSDFKFLKDNPANFLNLSSLDTVKKLEKAWVNSGQLIVYDNKQVNGSIYADSSWLGNATKYLSARDNKWCTTSNTMSIDTFISKLNSIWGKSAKYSGTICWFTSEGFKSDGKVISNALKPFLNLTDKKNKARTYNELIWGNFTSDNVAGKHLVVEPCTEWCIGETKDPVILPYSLAAYMKSKGDYSAYHVNYWMASDVLHCHFGGNAYQTEMITTAVSNAGDYRKSGVLFYLMDKPIITTYSKRYRYYASDFIGASIPGSASVSQYTRLMRRVDEVTYESGKEVGSKILHYEYLDGSSWKELKAGQVSLDKIANISASTANTYKVATYKTRIQTFKTTAGKHYDTTILSNLGGAKPSAKWATIGISGSTYNVGNRYAFEGLTYGKSTNFNAMASAIDNSSNLAPVRVTATPNEQNTTANTIMNTSWTKNNADGNATTHNTKTSKTDVNSNVVDDSTGISVGMTYGYKNTAVSSSVTKVTVAINPNPNTKNAVTVKNGDKTANYDSNSSGDFILDYTGLQYIVVVPNYATKPSDAAIKSALSGVGTESVNTKFQSLFSSAVRNGVAQKGDTVGTGCLAKDNKCYGYTVYALVVDMSAYKDNFKDSVVLQDYQLNKLTTGIYSRSHQLKTAKSNVFFSSDASSGKNIYTANLYDISDTTGKIIARDDTLIKSGRLPLIVPYNYSISRNSFKAGHGYNMTDTQYNLAKLYSVNVTRGLVENKVISSIYPYTSAAKTKINSSWLYANNFGYTNKPASNSEALKIAKRDSNALLASFTDTFKFKSEYSGRKKANGDRYLFHQGIFRYFGSANNLLIINDTSNSALKGSRTNEIDIKLTSYIRKYNSSNNAVGAVNDKLLGSTSANTGSTNGFRYAYAKCNSPVLKYYPEVFMEMTSYTTTGYSSAERYIIPTMGDYLRQTQAGSLYFMSVGKSGNGTMTGNTTADMTANDGAIYRGSDITLQTKDGGMSLNFYGYSLDIINKDVDTQNYNSIVSDSSNIYKDWGNTDSTSILQNEFGSWVNSITDNIDVDITMSLSNGKKYSNFSTSFSGIKPYVTSNTFKNAYSITVKHGAIDTSTTGYKNMISQIKSDYGCNSYEEAEALFKSSGIEDAIKASIESDTSSSNKSQAGPSVLGNNSHWYDEVVRTFVIRRYAITGLSMGDIVIQDKIDYNANTSKTVGSGIGSTVKGTNVNGNWLVSVYLTKDTAGLSKGTKLVTDTPVSGADFKVSYKTTEDAD